VALLGPHINTERAINSKQGYVLKQARIIFIFVDTWAHDSMQLGFNKAVTFPVKVYI